MTPDEFEAWRKAKGWTQAQAAEALGVSERQVRRYASGEQGISEKTAKLCKMLKAAKAH